MNVDDLLTDWTLYDGPGQQRLTDVAEEIIDRLESGLEEDREWAIEEIRSWMGACDLMLDDLIGIDGRRRYGE